MSTKVQFVFGGTRSGKSDFSEQLVAATGKNRVYLATGTAGDSEMAVRIACHRARRGDDWQTIEEPLDVIKALKGVDSNIVVLFDCVTFWLANLLEAKRDPLKEVGELCTTLSALSCDVIIVSNELGMGVVPSSALGREFRDLQGEANQMIAAVADTVFFVAAGLGVQLKGKSDD